MPVRLTQKGGGVVLVVVLTGGVVSGKRCPLSVVGATGKMALT